MRLQHQSLQQCNTGEEPVLRETTTLTLLKKVHLILFYKVYENGISQRVLLLPLTPDICKSLKYRVKCYNKDRISWFDRVSLTSRL